MISVCIPTYNRRGLLEETIGSIRKQMFEDYEVIVCDDCSTDDTFEYLQSLNWDKLKVVRNRKNLNIFGSLARLFQLAKGKYIAMQHDHDIYMPNYLAKMLELMEANPTVGFGYCSYHFILNNGAIIKNPDTFEMHMFTKSGLLSGKEFLKILATKVFTPVPAMATIFRREIVERVGNYRPDWYLAADEDLYRRIASISDVAYCPERLFYLRERPAEREQVLGGWKGLYTIYEFREDTTKRYYRGNKVSKSLNLLRLRFLRYGAIGKYSVSLWLKGRKDVLGNALNLDGLPCLPTRRYPMNKFEMFLASILVRLLIETIGLGIRFGRWRKIVKSM